MDGDFVYAKDTTLGGDDGIAIAMALALLGCRGICPILGWRRYLRWTRRSVCWGCLHRCGTAEGAADAEFGFGGGGHLYRQLCRRKYQCLSVSPTRAPLMGRV